MTRRWLLVSLLGAIALAACAYALWPRGPTATPNPPPADPKLLAALQERTSRRAARMPLEQIVARLAESHGIRIDVDTAALAATLGPIDTRISVDLPEMRLQTMLTLLAEAVHEKLTAVIDGSRVLITTRQAAFNDPRRFIAHVYPIPVEFRRRPEFTEQGLATLITTCVEPMSWKLLGPAPYVSELPNAIVVTAAPQMHAQIKQLLAQLASLQSADPQPLTPIWLGDAASEDFDRIHAALRQRVSIDAHQQPLRALIKQLSDQHGVPICLELNRLRRTASTPTHRSRSVFSTSA